MWAYLLRRLIQAVLILLGVSFITFLLLFVVNLVLSAIYLQIIPPKTG